MIRCLIIDDSRLARQELRTLLKDLSEVNVLDEAENIKEAKVMIESLDPDLIFLDIQMPGGSGFDLLESLDTAPAVIFTTAYDEFAVQAFEVNALDYLQKPISKERLVSALNTASERIQPTGEQQKDRLSLEDQVFVREGEQCWFVQLSDISMMEIEGNNSRIRFEDQNPLITKSLNYMEERLDPKYFFRANRQQIINLKWIKKIDPWFSGSIRVTLKDGSVIDVSRRQTARFKEIMSF
jgi:two-component system LytT family response regulator